MQQKIYQTLDGGPRPEHVAIFGNADPAQKEEWTRILSRNCNVSVRREIYVLTCAHFPLLFVHYDIKIKTSPVSIDNVVIIKGRM